MRVVLAGFFFVASNVGMNAFAQDALPGDEIRNLVAGKNVFLSVPLGGEFPLRYETSGIVAGSGEGVGLGKFMAPKDSGKWWVANNRLCQQWKSWYDGKPFCLPSAARDRTRFAGCATMAMRARRGSRTDHLPAGTQIGVRYSGEMNFVPGISSRIRSNSGSTARSTKLP